MQTKKLLLTILLLLTSLFTINSKTLTKQQKQKQKDNAAVMVRPPVLRFFESSNDGQTINCARLIWNYNEKKSSVIFGEEGTKGNKVDVCIGKVSGKDSGFYADFTGLEVGKNYFYKISGRSKVKFNCGPNFKSTSNSATIESSTTNLTANSPTIESSTTNSNPPPIESSKTNVTSNTPTNETSTTNSTSTSNSPTIATSTTSANSTYKIILCSDHQTYPELTQKAFMRFKGEKPGLVISCGDMLEDGKIKNWDKNFFQKVPYLGGAPFCAAQGNNDTGGPYFRNFFGMEETYYTFTYGPIRFIAINTNTSTGPNSKQFEWLKEVLQNNQSKFTIVFGHHGFYLSGTSEQGSQKLRNDLSPLFEQFNVNLVVTGHHHIYDRTSAINGVTYLTLPTVSGDISTGNKPDKSTSYYANTQSDFNGYGVMLILDNSLEIQIKDLNGKIKDQFSL